MYNLSRLHGPPLDKSHNDKKKLDYHAHSVCINAPIWVSFLYYGTLFHPEKVKWFQRKKRRGTKIYLSLSAKLDLYLNAELTVNPTSLMHATCVKGKKKKILERRFSSHICPTSNEMPISKYVSLHERKCLFSGLIVPFIEYQNEGYSAGHK